MHEESRAVHRVEDQGAIWSLETAAATTGCQDQPTRDQLARVATTQTPAAYFLQDLNPCVAAVLDYLRLTSTYSTSTKRHARCKSAFVLNPTADEVVVTSTCRVIPDVAVDATRYQAALSEACHLRFGTLLE